MTVQEEFNQFKAGITVNGINQKLLPMKWEIKYNKERIIVNGDTVEEAIKEFKKLGIHVESKEISISSFGNRL
jgi:hypothetical protein